MIKNLLLPYLVYFAYSLLTWTWRKSVYWDDEFTKLKDHKLPVVFAHFHQDELVLVSLARSYGIATMVSTSKDGELMNRVLNLLGGKTARGSSTRGAVSALKGLIRLTRKGFSPSIAVDGPKGPIYEVKPGIFEVSRATNLPIICAGVAAEPRIDFLKSWNKTFLPKPFARVSISFVTYSKAMSRESDPRSLEEAKALQKRLFDAKRLSVEAIATQISR